jgi:UDPglucose 6-dehydrogenase/GDP-mannose 6-dehydrogenase
MSNVSIVGSGYVGLVTGAGLAEIGHDVVCVDLDQSRVDAINQGQVPFHEPGLGELLGRHSGKRLHATTDLRSAIHQSNITFIAVGTPSRSDGSIDLSQVLAAAQGIGEAIRTSTKQHIVLTKSTVVPGTTQESIVPALEKASGKRVGEGFQVGVNPEFLTEGSAVSDFLQPDRIVIGAFDDQVAKEIRELYAPLGDIPAVLTKPGTAELIKYASNTLLATMISFSNEMANLAEELDGVDIVDVMEGVHNSRYLTSSGSKAAITGFLEAGCGFGGSCLPKDTRALVALGRHLGIETPLLSAVLEVNQHRAERVLRILRRHIPELSSRTVLVLGLSFKPDTDDVRESPAIPIVERLLTDGARVLVHDPMVGVGSMPPSWQGHVEHRSDLKSALKEAEAVILVTKWDEYRHLPETLAEIGHSPVIIDGRRFLSADSSPDYDGIGR